MSEIASKYSVHPTQISQWKKLVLSQLPEAFSANKKKMQLIRMWNCQICMNKLDDLRLKMNS